MNNMFERSYSLADLLFLTSNTPTYVSFLEADLTGYDLEDSLIKWAGGIGKDSGPVMYGPWKAFTLLAKGERFGVSKTPVPGFHQGCPWKGGLRGNRNIISCSGWENDVIDLALASLLMWSLSEEVRFHHVGFRHKSEEECLEAIKETLKTYGGETIFRPAYDHERWYTKVESKAAPNGCFWIEHQLWPSKKTQGLHWDLATSNPEALIRYISNKTETEGEYWERGKDNPCACISFMEDDLEVSIMARPQWTAVEDW